MPSIQKNQRDSDGKIQFNREKDISLIPFCYTCWSFFNFVRQFQKSSKMSKNSCRDLKTGRFGLVRRSLGEGGWLFSTPCHGIAVRRRRNKTTIFISSTIFFQSNFAGLLKLPLVFLIFIFFCLFLSQTVDKSFSAIKAGRMSGFPAKKTVKIGNIGRTTHHADLRNRVRTVFKQFNSIRNTVFE